MKKSLFLIPCLAAALWSCSDKDVIDNPNKGPESQNDPSYISVNITGVSSSTRDGSTSDHPYADGESHEWSVS